MLQPIEPVIIRSMSPNERTQRILLTFVGNRDPYSDPASEEPGPVLSLLLARPFDHAVLFCTSGEYLERARQVERSAQEAGSSLTFSFHLLEFNSVIDYEEIYQKLSKAVKTLSFWKEDVLETSKEVYVLLDPGTPQIQTCWFLLVRSGELPAVLLQGVPPRFAGGTYRVREVSLGETILPQVLHPVGPRGSEPVETYEGLSFEGKGIVLDDLFILGVSEKFQKAVSAAQMVARYGDVSVLIEGETGTGKEILARLIHRMSPRQDRPFVPVNCGALSPHLVESEFFGHVKGSFTGADRDRMGKFRAAEGGTIFLDEIGDLPLEIQPKLLRVLQERRVQPVGSDREYPVNVRVLAATNRNLLTMIEKGSFRRDLYDRLNQFSLHIPPLRERDKDIQILAGHFLDQWNRKYKEEKQFAPEVLDVFYRYSWPGNVRELQNTVIALCASSQGKTLGIDLLPPPLRTPSSAVSSLDPKGFRIPEEGIDLKAFLYQMERSFYEQALKQTGGNREKAASLLGIRGPAFRKALKERFPDL